MPATLRLTDALADSLADAVRRGVPIETATGQVGISQQQYHAWLRCSESGLWPDGSPMTEAAQRQLAAFSVKIARAKDDFEASMVDAVRNAVGVVGASGVPEWRPALELLKAHPHTRQRWGNRTVVEQTGTVKHEHTLVRQLDDAALLAALPDPSL